MLERTNHGEGDPIGGTRDRGQNGTFPGNWGKLGAEIGRLKRWINFIWKLRVARVIVHTENRIPWDRNVNFGKTGRALDSPLINIDFTIQMAAR